MIHSFQRFLRINLLIYLPWYFSRKFEYYIVAISTVSLPKAAYIYAKAANLAKRNPQHAQNWQYFRRLWALLAKVSGQYDLTPIEDLYLAKVSASFEKSRHFLGWRKFLLRRVPAMAVFSLILAVSVSVWQLSKGSFEVKGELRGSVENSSAQARLPLHYSHGYYFSNTEYRIEDQTLYFVLAPFSDTQAEQNIMVSGENDGLLSVEKNFLQKTLWPAKQKLQSKIRYVFWQDRYIELAGTSIYLSVNKQGQSSVAVLKGSVNILAPGQKPSRLKSKNVNEREAKPTKRIEANQKITFHFSKSFGKTQAGAPTGTDDEVQPFSLEQLKESLHSSKQIVAEVPQNLAQDFVKKKNDLQSSSKTEQQSKTHHQAKDKNSDSDIEKTAQQNQDAPQDDSKTNQKPNLRLLLKDGTTIHCFLLEETDSYYTVRLQGSTDAVQIAKEKVEKEVKL